MEIKDLFYYDNAKRIVDEGKYELAVMYMDDDLREKLHMELAPCSDLEFLVVYMTEHEKKFGEVWEIAKENPIW